MPEEKSSKTYAVFASPVGRIFAVCAHDGGCAIEAVFIGKDAKKEFPMKYGMMKKEKACNALKKFGVLLKKYFSGLRVDFDLPLKPGGSAFQRRVWRTIAVIPYGETRTYAEIARRCSSPKAFRAVGSACGRNPLPIIVPCHRVVSSAGLGGYSGGGAAVKRKLLRIEGAVK